MEDKENIIEPLFERIESYGKTTLELWKLKLLNKGADVVSTVVAKAVGIIAFIVFLMLFNIGLSLWVGELLGKTYYGFFCVGGLYLIIGLVFFYLKYKSIKKTVSDAIISEILN